MKYLKVFNESLDFDDINWELSYKNLSKDVGNEISRITRKIGLPISYSSNHSGYLEWSKTSKNTLIYNQEFINITSSLKLTEDLYDSLYVLIIQGINDLYEVNCKLECSKSFVNSDNSEFKITLNITNFEEISNVFNELKNVFNSLKIKVSDFQIYSKCVIKFNIPIDYHF